MDEQQREKHRLYMRHYRTLHPDRSAESRAYRERHGDELRKKRSTREHMDKANKWARDRRARDPEKASFAAAQWNYDLNRAEYEKMLGDQGGGCYFCGRKDDVRRRIRRLAVEHDHSTGRIRGIVCMNCNLSLSAVDKRGFSDLYRDPEKLSRYLGREVSISIHPSTPRREEAVALWKSGLTAGTVARRMGINRSAVYLMLKASVESSW